MFRWIIIIIYNSSGFLTLVRFLRIGPEVFQRFILLPKGINIYVQRMENYKSLNSFQQLEIDKTSQVSKPIRIYYKDLEKYDTTLKTYTKMKIAGISSVT